MSSDPESYSSPHNNIDVQTFSVTCNELPAISTDIRKAAATGPKSRSEYDRIVANMPALHEIELRNSPEPGEFSDSIKVVFWNLERCKSVEASAKHLAKLKPDVILLCELDVGMARTAQKHTARELAEKLQHGYAFAVEFVELGLGDEAEQTQYAGAENMKGLHGNAILSSSRITSPLLIRFCEDGKWFDAPNREHRLGGRIAVAAKVAIAGTEVALICTHFESTGDPQSRALEMRRLLSAIEDYTAGSPVILAGDLNTHTTLRSSISDPAQRAALVKACPDRFANPVSFEPLFELAKQVGYEWLPSNSLGTTQRPHDEPDFERKLDWILTRNLRATNPSIIPATDQHGRVLSDHDMLSVLISSTKS